MTEGTTPPVAARISFTLALLGLLVSAYLTFEHFTGSATLACAGNGVVDCLKVTTSRWSVVAGVPVAVAGLAYFIGMTALCAPIESTWNLNGARIVGAAVGVLGVLWLIYVELFEVDAICLWCTGVHAITLLLFGAVLWWRETERADS